MCGQSCGNREFGGNQELWEQSLMGRKNFGNIDLWGQSCGNRQFGGNKAVVYIIYIYYVCITLTDSFNL